MDLFRVLCNGVMALSVSSFAGWLYSAHPSDVSRVAIKAMDMVGPIVTPRAKEPPMDIVRLPPPNSQALPNLAPSAKSATLAPTTQPATPNTKPAGKASQRQRPHPNARHRSRSSNRTNPKSPRQQRTGALQLSMTDRCRARRWIPVKKRRLTARSTSTRRQQGKG